MHLYAPCIHAAISVLPGHANARVEGKITQIYKNIKYNK